MAATNTAPPPVDSAATVAATASVSSEELTAKAVHKRYEGLVMVRTKAIKGKGAWYWAHLEPMLVHNSDTGLPKAVKLRCSLCDAVFSASNPSRTASEHLKRGTCPNFNSVTKSISSISPSSVSMASPAPSLQPNNRKRSSSSASAAGGGGSGCSYHVPPLAIVDPSRFELAFSQAMSATTVLTPTSGNLLPQQPHLMLSGGKEDLGALAMLEDSVKKLKSPKTSPGPTLSKTQIDCTLDFLADWVFESCGSVSFSSLEHPKFRAFLNQVGLPAVSRRDFTGARLDTKYEEAKAESEARIRDAMFFQIASDGWKSKNYGVPVEESLVNLTVNLPNGTSLYRKAAFVSGSVPSKYAEEVLWETITDICGNAVQQCVGIVADKFKAKALRNLETQYHWMVNLSCQFQAFNSLIKDFSRELPLFKTVTGNCFKLANFFNYRSQIRNSFQKYQLQEHGHAGLLRVPLRESESVNIGSVYTMVEDILNSARTLRLVLLDESYKMVAMEEPIAREVGEMIQDVGFWNELEAVHSLIKLIKDMAQDIEAERPLVGQCLPLWDDLRAKVRDWCSKFHIAEGPVEKVIERRFKKNYHPAWAAAFILNPLYLIKDTSGKYLPPFKRLNSEQEKDVDKLITRLVSREEAHIVLMELMKWRTEGLDPVYARAVQMRERDPVTGKMKIANPQSSRLVWETHLTEFKSLWKVAVRLIFLHATSCGFKCNWSFLRWVCAHGHSRAAPTSFSYNVLSNASTPPGSSQQSSSSSVINSNPPASPLLIQLPVSGVSSSSSPSFSYNISQSSVAFPSNQLFQSSGNTLTAVAQEAGTLSSASTIPQPVSLPADNSTSSTNSVSSISSLSQVASWVPSAPSFFMPPGMPGTPGTPGPPGIAAPAQISSNLTVPSVATDSSSSSVPRPTMPTAPVLSSPAIQPQICTPYGSFPAMAAPPQGIWLQPSQMGGLPRSPFQPYPAAFPGPFPLPARGMPLPSVPLPDSQPPGVTPLGTAPTISVSSAASGHMLAGTLRMQPELPPPGIDNRKNVEEVGTQDGAAVKEQLDAWTAHKTEAGVVYYYNAVTGESTYDKPPGFKGEHDKVLVQPTPVSTTSILGTDWVLVTTSDGKKYYYNSKTKISSWQIPSEVTELKKKQDGEHSISLPHANLSTEKGSAPISLNAPAISTGGRDAMALKASAVPGSSSALDMIKKKLQDAGSPISSSPNPAPSGMAASELNGSRAVDTTVKGLQSEDSKDKLKDANGDGNMSDSSSDSEDADSGPTKEECIIQFKGMLKERGVAPFSKWEKELPKIVFDPRFKAIPSYSARRSLFEHYVKTRAEEERKEKRAAQKAAIEGFKQLLGEASEDIDHNTDYQTFRKKWGADPRFEALDRKDREHLLNERVFPLKKAAEEKVQALRAAAATSFKSMLREKRDITANSRWSKVKDSLRNDSRYKSAKHQDREIFFNEYISELKAGEEESEREAKAKREEQEKLKERERELRKRKEREEQEMERVRLKVRRKESVASFQALLVETIKDPQASWTESKPKLEKDPQGRATNADLDPSDIEKLFREHIKMLNERCVQEFRSLLAEVLTAEAAAQETEEGKTVLNSWSTAKRLLKPDPRYNKMPRKEREVLWRRYVDEILRRQKVALDEKEEKKHVESKGRNSVDSGRFLSGSRRRTHDRR